MVVKDKKNANWVKWTALGVYIVVVCISTRFAISIVDHIHKIKNRCGYDWDEKDMRFGNRMDIVRMALACMIASIISGITGGSGALVLAPLFLKYNMIPTVMSSTNQYIGLLASFSVFIQFALAGEVTWDWAICFGLITIICAFVGIMGI